jgi:hypothetical protein
VLPRQYEKFTGSIQFSQAMSGVTVTCVVVNSLGSTVYTHA